MSHQRTSPASGGAGGGVAWMGGPFFAVRLPLLCACGGARALTCCPSRPVCLSLRISSTPDALPAMLSGSAPLHQCASLFSFACPMSVFLLLAYLAGLSLPGYCSLVIFFPNLSCSFIRSLLQPSSKFCLFLCLFPSLFDFLRSSYLH